MESFRPGSAEPEETLVVRNVTVDDAAEIRRIVCDSGVLDVNSLYTYLLLCRQFRSTCLVAETAGRVAGFVTAWKPPEEPDTIFVWQIGVDAGARGRGVASRLLDRLLGLPACREVDYLTTTITPDNKPSQALFRSLADRLHAECRVTAYFERSLFNGAHEPEELFRIGPIS